MDKEYTREELENMTIRELCEIALGLGIISLEGLVEEIWGIRGVSSWGTRGGEIR